MKKIFRDKALQKASSPDQIDDLMHIIQPRVWISVFAVLFLIIISILWGFLGNIPTLVNGTGIILRSDMVGGIYANGNGELMAISVMEGDAVSKGQVIGRIKNPELRAEIENLEKHIAELSVEINSQNQITDSILDSEMHYAEQKYQSIKISITRNKEKQKILEDRIRDQDELLKKGLITRQTYLNSLDELKKLEINEDQLISEFTEIEIEKSRNTKGARLSIFDNRLILKDQLRKLELLKIELDDTENVRSNYDGIVLEQRAFVGSLVTQGTVIAVIEPSTGNTDQRAVVFVLLKDAKKLRQGMKSYIVPTVVKKEESGMIIGEVSHVAEYPISYVGLVNIVGSDLLASEISKSGVPVFVKINLEKDPNSFSGYRWTSGKGPNIKIKSGTQVEVNILVKEQKPISLLLPWLKKLTGIY